LEACLLEKVFHEDLIDSHGLKGISSIAPPLSLSWQQKHMEAYVAEIQKDEALPVVWCGNGIDSSDHILLELLNQAGGDATVTVNTLLVNHTTQEECFLLHVTPSMFDAVLGAERGGEPSALGGGGWRMQMLPALLKIHPSVLSFTETSPSAVGASSHGAISPPHLGYNRGQSTAERRSSADSVEEEGPSETAFELVVQLVPHTSSSPSSEKEEEKEAAGRRRELVTPAQCMAAVLQEWRGDHGVGGVRRGAYFSRALSSFSAVMEEGKSGGVKTAWEHRREEAAYTHHQALHSQSDSMQQSRRCQLPPTSEIQYTEKPRVGGGLIKITNLQTWWIPAEASAAFSSSSTSFSSSSSNYCLLALVELLSLHTAVLGVAVSERATVMNYNARGLLQSGRSGDSPLTAAGLIGTGQVVSAVEWGEGGGHEQCPSAGFLLCCVVLCRAHH
jgi:hypothetical protein